MRFWELERANVDIVLYIPPAHAELRAIYDLGHNEARRAFKSYVNSLAPTVDFDIDNEFTRNRDNFTDPFHISDEVVDQVVADLLAEVVGSSVRNDHPIQSRPDTIDGNVLWTRLAMTSGHFTRVGQTDGTGAA